MNSDRRLYLSRTNKVIGGVCGGIGEHLGIDPVFIRIITVLLALFHGIGLIGYFVAWLVIPRQPAEAGAATIQKVDHSSQNRFLLGAILIIIGLYFLIDTHFWWWHLDRYWPLLLVAAGLLLIFRFVHKGDHHKEGVNEPSQI